MDDDWFIVRDLAPLSRAEALARLSAMEAQAYPRAYMESLTGHRVYFYDLRKALESKENNDNA
jgi:hypothetical protein